MEQRTAADTRCPRCSAAVRPGAPWCTQCYAPAGAAPGPAADVRPAAAGALPVVEPVGSPPAAPASTGTWPCSSCSQPNALALPSCAACGTPFLAAVLDDRPTVVLPVVGDVLALSPARRLALALGTVVVLLLVACVLALLLA